VPADPVLDQPWLWKVEQAGYNLYALPGTDEFNAGQILRYVHPDSGQDVTFQPMQIQWRNTIGQIAPVGTPQDEDVVLGEDTLSWDGAFGPGLNFVWEAQTTQLAKQLEIASLAALGTEPPAWMDPDGLSLVLQFMFQVSNDVQIWIDGQVWDKASPRITGAAVEFRAGDTPLWWFRAANATDWNGSQVSGEMGFDRQTPKNLLVDVRIPWSWLQVATYPVYVDPTVNEVVGASADDAQESTVGFVTIDGSYLACSQSGAWAGARFQTVAVEGTCNSATFWIWCANASNDDPDVVIYAEDEDDTAAYSAGSTSDISGRNYTSASTVWQASGIGTGYVAAPDLADEVGEVLARPGWASGNDMCIAYAGQSSSPFTVNAWDGNPTRCPKLDIDYTGTGGAALQLLALLGVGE